MVQFATLHRTSRTAAAITMYQAAVAEWQPAAADGSSGMQELADQLGELSTVIRRLGSRSESDDGEYYEAEGPLKDSSNWQAESPQGVAPPMLKQAAPESRLLRMDAHLRGFQIQEHTPTPAAAEEGFNTQIIIPAGVHAGDTLWLPNPDTYV